MYQTRLKDLTFAILMASLVAPSTAMAFSECEFDQAPGELIRFLPIDAGTSFIGLSTTGQSNAYPDWFSNPESNAGLDGQVYFARFAKMKPEVTKTVVVKDPFSGENTTIRYYSALVENCDLVYLRVADNDLRLASIAGAKRHLEQLPLAKIGYVFGVRFEDSVLHFRGLTGQQMLVAAPANTPFHPVNAEYQTLEPWSEVTVLGVDDHIFTQDNYTIAGFSVKVRLSDGTEGLIPGNLDILHNTSVMNDIDAETQDKIRKGILRIGMTDDQVFLAWGHADSILQFPVVEKANGARQTIYGNEPAPHETGTIVGIESHWRYASRMGAEPLIFTDDGILSEGNQKKAVLDYLLAQ